MDRFVQCENIVRYRKLIAITEGDPNRDEARYQMLLRQLAEEQARPLDQLLGEKGHARRNAGCPATAPVAVGATLCCPNAWYTARPFVRLPPDRERIETRLAWTVIRGAMVHCLSGILSVQQLATLRWEKSFARQIRRHGAARGGREEPDRDDRGRPRVHLSRSPRAKGRMFCSIAPAGSGGREYIDDRSVTLAEQSGSRG